MTPAPALVSSSCSSSRDAFARRVVAYLPELLRHALRLERDPSAAEDLVQDTFERAVRFQAAFEEGTHLRAWLFRMQKNLFVSRRRRAAVARRVQENLLVDPNGWCHQNRLDAQPSLSPPVAGALAELSPRLGRVIELVDLSDYSYRDAAEELDVPVGTVMSRLHRGRARLKERLVDGPRAA